MYLVHMYCKDFKKVQKNIVTPPPLPSLPVDGRGAVTNLVGCQEEPVVGDNSTGDNPSPVT